jgi:hypothetical protein
LLAESKGYAEKLKEHYRDVRARLNGPIPPPRIAGMRPSGDRTELDELKARIDALESQVARLRGMAGDSPIMRVIKDRVAYFYGFSSKQLESAAKRPRDLLLARHVAYYLCCRLSGRSTVTIGHYFGGRDHTTIIHGRDRIEELRVTNRDLDLQIAEIEQSLIDKIPTTKATEQRSEHHQT